MQRNIAWLAPLLWYGIPTIATAIGGWYMYRNVSAANAVRETQVSAQAEVNRQQALASQIQSQMMIEQLTPVAWVAVPVMVLVGGYFLWKSAQEVERE